MIEMMGFVSTPVKGGGRSGSKRAGDGRLKLKVPIFFGLGITIRSDQLLALTN